MTTTIEYALMAGASYFDTRNPINRFPTPQSWVSFNHQTRDSGFEALSFVKPRKQFGRQLGKNTITT